MAEEAPKEAETPKEPEAPKEPEVAKEPEPAPAAAEVAEGAAAEKVKSEEDQNGENANPDEEGAEKEGGEEEEEREPEPEPEPPAPKPPTKFEIMHEFFRTTDVFMNQFDEMVANRGKCRSVYLKNLNPLRDSLVELLHRFGQFTRNWLPHDDKIQEHIKCCGEQEHLFNSDEFEEHYEEVHEKDNEAVVIPETEIMEAYQQAVEDYIAEGVVVNDELMYRLRRILRKSNLVLTGVWF